MSSMDKEIKEIKEKDKLQIKALDEQRVSNEIVLKPSLGHPNNLDSLNKLDEKELKRQKEFANSIESYMNTLRDVNKQYAENYFNHLIKSTETLLLKFDEILTVDDVHKHEMLAEKHETNELLKRKMLGLPLEDGEPEPLIKRGPSKWDGLSKYNLNRNDDAKISLQYTSVQIVTAKTTLAHKETMDLTKQYYESFKEVLLENMDQIEKEHAELKYQSERLKQKWANSLQSIKKIYE